PTSYWDDSMATKIANIKGEFRRREVIEAARSSKLGDLPNEISLEKLPDVLRDAVGKMHPAFMGGEYLPDSKPTEVEIARISLESTTWDVISIRARKTATCIKYRIVDEEGSNFEFGPKQSKRPLTFGQLISLIDGASLEGQPGGLTTVFRDDNLSSGLHDPEELLD